MTNHDFSRMTYEEGLALVKKAKAENTGIQKQAVSVEDIKNWFTDDKNRQLLKYLGVGAGVGGLGGLLSGLVGEKRRPLRRTLYGMLLGALGGGAGYGLSKGWQHFQQSGFESKAKELLNNLIEKDPSQARRFLASEDGARYRQFAPEGFWPPPTRAPADPTPKPSTIENIVGTAKEIPGAVKPVHDAIGGPGAGTAALGVGGYLSGSYLDRLRHLRAIERHVAGFTKDYRTKLTPEQQKAVNIVRGASRYEPEVRHFGTQKRRFGQAIFPEHRKLLSRIFGIPGDKTIHKLTRPQSVAQGNVAAKLPIGTKVEGDVLKQIQDRYPRPWRGLGRVPADRPISTHVRKSRLSNRSSAYRIASNLSPSDKIVKPKAPRSGRAGGTAFGLGLTYLPTLIKAVREHRAARQAGIDAGFDQLRNMTPPVQ